MAKRKYENPSVEGLAETVNESGFPLQLGVQRIVASDSRWRVDLKEHAWRDPLTGDEKFIDLVIRNEEDRVPTPMRIVVEAKRAAETEWIFLREDEPKSVGDDHRLPTIVRVLSRSRMNATMIDGWLTLPFKPGLSEVGFCVVRSAGQRQREMLEKTAAELVRATDELAILEDTLHARQRQSATNSWPSISRVYIPIIVTTARLYVCDAEYGEVNLITGRVDSTVIKEVEAVKFTKSFGSIPAQRSRAKSVAEFSERAARSVIIVQATGLGKMLGGWDFGVLKPEIHEALWPRDG